MKSILYIHHTSSMGGGSLALLRTIEKLDRVKYYPVVVFPKEGDVIRLFEEKGIRVIMEPRITTFAHSTQWYDIKHMDRMIFRFFCILISAFAVWRIIKRENPDIVYLNTSGLLGSALGTRIAGRPIIWHVREPLSHGYFYIRQKIISHYINFFSTVVISICKNDTKRLVPSQKLKLIYDFVDFRQFDRDISAEVFKREFKIGSKDKTVGMFGGVSYVKGTLIFIKAAEIIYNKYNKSVKFLIFGTPGFKKKKEGSIKIIYKVIKNFFLPEEDYVSKVMAYLDNSRARDNIYFCGNRTDIPKIMAGLDIIVFPSTVPHSAIPLMEAGAMAKPVVASNLGGPNEIVIDGVTGFLAPPNDPESLAKAIIQILEDEKLAKQLGENGNKRAKELFNADINSQKISDIFEEILIIRKKEYCS